MGATIDPSQYVFGKNNVFSQVFRTANDPGGIFARELGMSDTTIFGEEASPIFDPAAIGDEGVRQRKLFAKSMGTDTKTAGSSILTSV